VLSYIISLISKGTLINLTALWIKEVEIVEITFKQYTLVFYARIAYGRYL